jgi:hypothetical protein
MKKYQRPQLHRIGPDSSQCACTTGSSAGSASTCSTGATPMPAMCQAGSGDAPQPCFSGSAPAFHECTVGGAPS